MSILKNRISEWIRSRREMKRLAGLQKMSWCPGCLQRGPWLAVFIHPLAPPDQRPECAYADAMPRSTKLARCMALVSLGVPLDPAIISYNTREAIEHPEDEEAAMIYDMMMETARMANAVVDAHRSEQGDKPSGPMDEAPEAGIDDGRDWASFDAGTGRGS